MISQIRKILYATDLSKNSSYAFYFAIDLAKRYDAKIDILHAIEPLPPYAEAYAAGVAFKIEEKERKEAPEHIKVLLREFCQKVEVQLGFPCLLLVSNVFARVGHPVEEILKVAEEEECDLIVLGSHGKGFLKQTFLGSVSHGVLTRSRKPVVIIPLPSEKTSTDLEGIL